MFKFTKISIILLLICSIEANNTIELLEKLINQQKEEFDYRLNNVIKVQEIYERRIEELMKQTSDFNEKRNDINSRSCYSNEIRYNTNQNVSANSSSPCKDWEPYKDEKCFKIFENVGLHTYQNAQYVCNQQNSAKLVSIRSLEEQMFFSNLLFKTHKVVDNVWIEAKYSSNKFKWADDSDVSFTNWAEGSPSNTVDKACVQMIPDGSSMGKWVDKPCNKKNLVVCQKMQPWSISQLQNTLLNVRKEFKDYKDVSDKKLNNLQQNPVPIGFIYVQLPSQPEPKDLWPTVDWKEVTSDYAGLFFRVLGGGSATFEQIQEENSPRVSKVQNSNLVELNQVKEDSSLSLPTGVWSNKIWTGQAPGHGSNVFLRFSVSDGEVRPRNRAMRIWKRSK